MQGIARIPWVHSVSEFKCFLGMVNFLNTYSPRLAQFNDSLRKCVKKSTLSVGTKTNTKFPCQGKSAVLQTDTSLEDLDVVLLQERHLIHFLSKCLQQHKSCAAIELVGICSCLNCVWQYSCKEHDIGHLKASVISFWKHVIQFL